MIYIIIYINTHQYFNSTPSGKHISYNHCNMPKMCLGFKEQKKPELILNEIKQIHIHVYNLRRYLAVTVDKA